MFLYFQCMLNIDKFVLRGKSSPYLCVSQVAFMLYHVAQMLVFMIKFLFSCYRFMFVYIIVCHAIF